jgi:hypothetical protein
MEPPRYPVTPLTQIDEVDVTQIKPEEFFNKYIARRIPVLLRGHLQDPSWHGEMMKDFDYLRRKSGEEIIKVETRGDASFAHEFGNGLETHMALNSFLTLIENGSEDLYMTTQKLPMSPEGEPDIVSPPMSRLIGDFPWQPALTGRLVVQNVNMWIGQSASGTSSGLHHDHHDNLYILLAGKKTFRLFSPAEAFNMYTTGQISRIHPNGRINYTSQPPTRADGADLRACKALKASERLERMAVDNEVLVSLFFFF